MKSIYDLLKELRQAQDAGDTETARLVLVQIFTYAAINGWGFILDDRTERGNTRFDFSMQLERDTYITISTSF